jgi:glycosyltransferase involved in cell wall biosynthesis
MKEWGALDVSNKFVFIMPAYNAENTIDRTIGSVAFQTYDNWKILIRDDMSTDKTIDTIKNACKKYNIPEHKLSFKTNTKKKWEVANIIDCLPEIDSQDIVCRLDADDWLCDCDVLSIINNSYEKTGVSVLWTAHRWAYTHQNISRPMPKNANPYEHPWVSSHLKTFRKFLIEDIKDENFRNQEGEYFKRIGDQAIYLPVLHQSAGNWYFEPIVAYHYTIDIKPQTFQTEDAKFQRAEAEFLRSRGYVD